MLSPAAQASVAAKSAAEPSSSTPPIPPLSAADMEQSSSLGSSKFVSRGAKHMEQEIVSEFLKRKVQIDYINQLQKLHLIRKFSQTIDEIERVHENDDDQIRIATPDTALQGGADLLVMGRSFFNGGEEIS